MNLEKYRKSLKKNEKYLKINIFEAKNIFFYTFREVGQENTKKSHVHYSTSCKITAPTDKMCGNESKICTPRHNYRFFQCIFPNFQYLIKFEGQ